MADRGHRPDRAPRAASDSPLSSRGGRIRYAIYTRKSSEEGLEQEFNSSMRSGRLARLTSAANSTKAGWFSLNSTTTPPSQWETWSGPR
jgi:hypothetical protein